SNIAVGNPVEVPEPGPVRGEEQLPGRRPAGLEDRFGAAAGHLGHVREAAGLVEARRVQRGAVPWHVRVVPGQPDQGRAIRGQMRARYEVGAAAQHGHVAAGQIYGNQGVDRLAAAGVILAYADQPVPARVDGDVGVAHAGVVGQLLRGFGWAYPVKVLIFEIDEVDGGVVADGQRAAAVFVDAAADVDRHRRDLAGGAVRRAADQGLPAALGRPALKPVDVRTRDQRPAQRYAAGDQEVGGERRDPGAVGRDRLGSGIGHWPRLPRPVAPAQSPMPQARPYGSGS